VYDVHPWLAIVLSFPFSPTIFEQPTLKDGTAKPQDVVPPKVLLTGFSEKGEKPPPLDKELPFEPTWTRNGSYMVFRQLQQLVPEFHKFTREEANRLVMKNPAVSPGLVRGRLCRSEAEKLTLQQIGARMVGRWPSGAPLDKKPFAEDIFLGADPVENNRFDMSEDLDQHKCRA
jgi:deferrochelatase/peroxidase EfeB